MALICCAFFLSGCAGLMYETLWVRLFALSSGHTAVAVSSVVAAYMGGLALGSRGGGRLADRLDCRRLLLLYIILETLTALAGWASLPLAGLIQPLIASPALVAAAQPLQLAVWFLAALVIVIIPATLMGATFPPLTRLFSLSGHHHRNVARAAGLLYGLNLLGAAAGTALAAFSMIPALGMRHSFAAAAGISLLAAALAAIPLGRREAAAQPPERDTRATPPLPAAVRVVLLAAGAAAMVAEIAWTRSFASIIGSSTYAFAVMLLTFLAGLALGTLSFPLVRGLLPRGTGTLAGLCALLAGSMIAYTPLVNRLPCFFLKLYPFAADGGPALYAVQFSLCAIVMIVPALLMGLLFPLVLDILGAGPCEAGSLSGKCYSMTTIGNIAGSMAGGLFLVPFIGAENSLMAAAALYGIAAAAVILLLPGRRPVFRICAATVVAAVLAAGITFRPRWDPYMLSSGMFLYARDYAAVKSCRQLKEAVSRHQLLYYKDGLSSTVAVMQSPEGERFVRVNGKTDASTGADMPTQLLLGCLPAMVFPGDPRSALVIGLGSGVTAGALGAVPSLAAIDCVEIEPAMADAARLFAPFNRRIMDSGRLRIINADARHYLAASARQYDLIISEPSNPWISGVASLFTLESFELARARLTGRGVFCQWFHSYLMRPEDFAMVMRTFAAAFPHTLLFSAGRGDFIMLGSVQPWTLDYASIEERFRSYSTLREDLARLRLDHPFLLLQSSFLLADHDFTAAASGAPVHHDDRPTLEFTAPDALNAVKESDAAILERLVRAQKTGISDLLRRVALAPGELAGLYNRAAGIFLSAKQPVPAARMLDRGLAEEPSNAGLWLTRGRVQQAEGRPAEAEKSFLKAAELTPLDPGAWFHLGLLYRSRGMNDRALAALETGLRYAPGDAMANLQAGVILFEQDRRAEARRLFAAGLPAAADPDIRDTLRYYLGLAGR